MSRHARPRLLIAAVLAALVAACTGGQPAGTASGSSPAAASAPPSLVAPSPSPAPPSLVPSPSGSPSNAVAERLATCAAEPGDDARRTCYAATLKEIVGAAADPRPVVAQIAETAWTARDFLLPNCHGLMHTVGREYAAEQGVTLATLMDYLPPNNDPGCSAGFSHGVVSGISSQLDIARPEAALEACAAGRNAIPALQLHPRLRPRVHAPDRRTARADAHDVHEARTGARLPTARRAPTTTTGSRRSASTTPRRRPTSRAIPGRCAARSRTCSSGRAGTGRSSTRGPRASRSGHRPDRAAVRGTGRPPAVGLRHGGVRHRSAGSGQSARAVPGAGGDDAISCIRGAKVQNLIKEPPAAFVDLIGRCAAFPGGTATECYRWLGKVLAVLTDGQFETTGCPQLPTPAARDACVAGARTMDEALVTFS